MLLVSYVASKGHLSNPQHIKKVLTSHFMLVFTDFTKALLFIYQLLSGVQRFCFPFHVELLRGISQLDCTDTLIIAVKINILYYIIIMLYIIILLYVILIIFPFYVFMHKKVH